MVNPFALSLLLALKAPSVAEAKDLGTHGIIFPITEEDPIALIHQKLSVMEERGEISLHERNLQKHAKSIIERPQPVEGVTKATESRVFYFDPSYRVSHDLKDHKGRVFAKKGAKINPLTKIALKQSLLFFDGDDEEQVEWTKAHLQDQNTKVKLILVKGSPLGVSETLNAPIYFDQSGLLTKKLGIYHVPACVTQEGLRLRIEEVVFKTASSCTDSPASHKETEK